MSLQLYVDHFEQACFRRGGGRPGTVRGSGAAGKRETRWRDFLYRPGSVWNFGAAVFERGGRRVGTVRGSGPAGKREIRWGRGSCYENDTVYLLLRSGTEHGTLSVHQLCTVFSSLPYIQPSFFFSFFFSFLTPFLTLDLFCHVHSLSHSLPLSPS